MSFLQHELFTLYGKRIKIVEVIREEFDVKMALFFPVAKKKDNAP